MGAWRLSLPHPAATGTLTLRFDLHERVFVSGRYAHEDEKFVLVVPLTCGTNIKIVLVLELDCWSLALVQYLALVNPHPTYLCGSEDEDEFEFDD